MYIQNVE